VRFREIRPENEGLSALVEALLQEQHAMGALGLRMIDAALNDRDRGPG
jgi:hypothetical protein